jgi:hypothetical protein
MSTTTSPSIVLYGPVSDHMSAAAKRLSEKTGLCEIDARRLFEEARPSTEEFARLITDRIQNERCRRGFALHHFPRDLPEQRQFEKELVQRFGLQHEFTKFKAVFLDPRQEDAERIRKNEPTYHRDNPEYDPYDRSSKKIIARPFALDSSNWIYDRSNLLSHFMDTRRPMAQVGVHKSADEAASDIIRVASESHEE